MAIPEEAPYTFTATATDPDIPAQTLAFSLLNSAPAGATIGSTSGVFTWTPTESQGPGSYSFDVQVSDGSLTDTKHITITVSDVNVAPVLAPIGNKFVHEQANLTFTVSATDQDIPSQTLTYSLDATSLAAGMSIDGSTGAFSWTPSESQGGIVYPVTITVTDNGADPANLTDAETFNITVYDADLYVNDGSVTGDIWCSAVGNDDNPGTAAAPLLTITKALTVINPGYKIQVDAGTYAERLIIDKSVSMIGAGADKSVIDGSNNGTVVTITANNVTFDGFTVQNSGMTGYDAGILLGTITGPGTGIGVTGCAIQNNKLTTSAKGIALAFGSDNAVKSNTLSGNGDWSILLAASTGNTIEANIISNNALSGIYLDNQSAFGGSDVSLGSTSNTIMGNTISNIAGGESLNLGENCNSNIVTNNIIDGGSYGIHIWRSNGQTVSGNTIRNFIIQPDPDKSAVAIRIRNGQNNTITGNTITSNMKGFEIVANAGEPYCTGNVIRKNKIYGNGSGIDASPSNGNYIVNAENNWWGNASGPYNTPNNTCGTGNSVTAYVDFMPWYTDEGMTIPTGGNGNLLVHNSSKNTYYCKIQDAIDDAEDDDYIYVSGGTFTEHLVINKTLTIENASDAHPILDGGGTGTVVTILADYTIFTGFDIRNSGKESADAGIMLGTVTGEGQGTGVNYCFVENNTLTNKVKGIKLAFSSENNIKGNTLSSNGEWSILLGASSNNNIERNSISNNETGGIYLDNESAFGGTVYDQGSNNNTINQNMILGIAGGESLNLGENCDGNKVTDNTISGGAYGIHVWKSNNNYIESNQVTNFNTPPKTGYSAVAIRIRNGQNNIIKSNTITGNMKGFEIVANEAPYCIGNQIYKNNISDNGSGLDASPSNGNYFVNASNNWWGDDSGPYNNPNNTCGIGNSVTAYVDFMPWISNLASGDTTYSGDNGDLLVYNTIKNAYYCKIQDAINDAAAGDQIEVSEGTFSEHLTINKSVVLKNAASAVPVIDGSDNGTVVTITANDVTFDGFTVQHSGLTGNDAGILLGTITGLGTGTGVSGCIIQHNILTASVKGIALAFSSRNTVKSNTLTGNGDWSILLGASTNNTLETNNISSNTSGGIYLDNQSAFGGSDVSLGSTGNTITGNTISNIAGGESLNLGENCNSNLVTNNIIDRGSYGIHIWKSNGQNVSGNTIRNFTIQPDPDKSAVAIRIRNGQNNIITGNTITSNMKGFEIVANAGETYCTGNEIHGNKIYDNGSGMDASPSNGNYMVDAGNNWWGNASGPYNTPNNTCGTGNSVTAYVDFMPWYTDEAMTTPTGENGDLLVHNTNKNSYFCKIQDAIDDADAGNTLEVATGTFSEHLTIGKSIVLKNAASAVPVIDGSKSGTVVTITANNVTFDGFTVQNSGLTVNDAGILLGTITGPGTGVGVTGCAIQNNKLTTSVKGIALAFGSANTVKRNTLTGNGDWSILLAGSNGNTLEANIISNNALSGIYLDNQSAFGGSDVSLGSTGNTITGNTISNIAGGESLNLGENCNSNFVTNNIIDGGSYGIHIWRSNGQNVSGNTIRNFTIQPGPAKSAVAIRIRNSQNNTITGNTITSNMKGFEIVANEGETYCTGNEIHGNKIYANGSGLDASPSNGNYFVNANNNWWGAPSGPAHLSNPCGTGNSVTDYVTFDPWYFQDGMSTLNTLPAVTIDPVADISTVTATPVVIAATAHYPAATGIIEPTVFTDAYVSTSGAFPAGCTIINVSLQSGTGTPIILPANFTPAGSGFYLTDILPQALPLAAFMGKDVTCTFTMTGATSATTIPLTVQFVTYQNKATGCISSIGQPESFSLNFNDEHFALSASGNQICNNTYSFSCTNAYPAIINLTPAILNDARISSDIPIPAGTSIAWSYSSLKGTFSGTYSLTTAASSLLFSTMTGLNPPLMAENGLTEAWNFTLSGEDLGDNTYNLTVDAFAKLNGITYIYNTNTLKMLTGPITTAPVMTACPGQLIEVPITVSGFTGTAVSLTLAYDPTVMTFHSFKNGTVQFTSTEVLANESGTSAFLRIGHMMSSAPVSSGTLITLYFNYTGGNTALTWDDTYDWWCEYADADYQAFCDDPTHTYYVDGTVIAADVPVIVYVDDDFGPTTPGWLCDHFKTIQEGVDRVEFPDGVNTGTVNVAEGTYPEQVTIHENITLSGASAATTFVKAPADQSQCVAGITGVGLNWLTDYLLAAYPSDWNGPTATGTPISVKVSGITFDANHTSHDCDRYSGVFFGCVQGADYPDAGLFDSKVINFNTADPSATGVRVLGDSKLSVADCDNIEYTINGIAAYGDLSDAPDPDVLMHDNTLVCTAPSLTGTEYALNICYGATGSITDNTVTDPATDGILVSSSNGVTITGNTISNQSNGIILNNANNCQVGTVSGSPNLISDCSSNGISMINASNNTLLRNYISGIHSGNTSTPGNCGWGIGLEGTSSNNQIGNGSKDDYNDLSQCDAGIIFYGTGTGNKANGNKIHGNSPHGLNNVGGAVIDATRNWWGIENGPTLADNPCGAGDALTNEANVTYEPWKNGLPAWLDVYKLNASAAVTTSINCNGGMATVTITASGGMKFSGTNSYSYTFNSVTNTTGIFTDIPSGNYSWSVTDDEPCTVKGTLFVPQPDMLSATVASTMVTCYGAGDGTITVSNPLGGNGTFEVSINNTNWYSVTASTPRVFNSLPPATYTVRIRDAANTGCVIVLGDQIINQPASALSATLASTMVTCYNANNGTITVSNPSGGWGTYEVSINNADWHSVSGTAPYVFTALSPISYTVQIRDAAHTGCITTLGTITITQPNILTAFVGTSMVTCFNASNGAITVSNPTGGYGTYETSINGTDWFTVVSGSSYIFTYLAPATYSVYLRDKANATCEINLGAHTITQPVVLSASVTSTPITCYNANNGTITVSNPAGGYGTYQTSINGAQWSTVTTATPHEFLGLSPGTYTVRIRDAAHTGCVIILGDQTITQPAILSASVASTMVTCFNANNGTITVSSPTGGYGTYETSINGTVWFTVEASSNYIFTDLAPATYLVSIRDKANPACVIELGNQTITQPTVLSATVSATMVTCNESADGTITVSNPTGGYGTYETSIDGNTWYTVSSTIPVIFSDLLPGPYTIQIRDAAHTGCVINLGIQTITQPVVLSATVTSTMITCHDANNGTITVSNPEGGYGPYQTSINGVEWFAVTTATPHVFSGLLPGPYTVQIRDFAHTGCVIDLSTKTITEPVVLTASVASTMITCYGANNGTITVSNPTGGYGKYETSINGTNWFTVETSSNYIFTNLTPATYPVSIRDKDNPACVIGLGNQEITQPDVLTAFVASTPVTCYGSSDGTITITSPAGGYGSYEYSVTGGSNWQPSGSFTGLAAGYYNVQIRDAVYQACFIILNSSLQITMPEALAATVTVTQPTCNTTADGQIVLSNPTGGSGDYEYRLDNGTWQSNPVFTGLTPGTYVVYIRDAAHVDCSIDLGPQTITAPAAIVLAGDINYFNTALTPMKNVNIELWPAGATAPTASVNTGASNHYSFANVCPGTYEVRLSTTVAAGGINATDAAQVNAFSVATPFPTIEKVRFFAGDVTVPNYLLIPDDARRILQYFVQSGNPSWSPRGEWTFWKPETTSTNPTPGALYPTVTINPGTTLPVTQHFYALSTGDFNCSFTPSTSKTARQTLFLNYAQTRQETPGTEIELPVYSGGDLKVTALSTILQFPSDKMEITGVYLGQDEDAPLMYSVSGNELRIGWQSVTAFAVNTGERLLTLKVRLSNTFLPGETIRLTLDGSDLNELADAAYQVINPAVLFIDVVEAAVGINDQPGSHQLTLTNYPNPFGGRTTLAYSLPSDGSVTLELFSMLGSKVKTLINGKQLAGDHSFSLDGTLIQPGVYFVVLRFEAKDHQDERVIKLVRDHE